jgi:hypothetical protein
VRVQLCSDSRAHVGVLFHKRGTSCCRRRDVAASAAFYRNVLGFVDVRRPSSFSFHGAWWGLRSSQAIFHARSWHAAAPPFVQLHCDCLAVVLRYDSLGWSGTADPWLPVDGMNCQVVGCRISCQLVARQKRMLWPLNAAGRRFMHSSAHELSSGCGVTALACTSFMASHPCATVA